ncbi:MAG: GNAT family N-acetyltransferase [Oscillospiraceae bacterium]|nr:GNAT family N-acetyltransferase [Oscillospiraceae bacterium]
MDCKITDMDLSHIAEYAKLFVSVFNSEPWNDKWTEETAVLRLENMMRTNTFIGKALYSENELKGFIYGQKEYYFNGIHFQIQEFCVKSDEQKKGYGKALLQELRNELDTLGVVNVYLITSHGESTEGYYQRRGFVTSDNMILMTNTPTKQG